MRVARVVFAAFGIGLALTAWGTFLLVRHGLSARDQPTQMEALVARQLRHWAVPLEARQAKNPVALAPEVLERGRAHFADHCASCHGNDGAAARPSGRTSIPR